MLFISFVPIDITVLWIAGVAMFAASGETSRYANSGDIIPIIVPVKAKSVLCSRNCPKAEALFPRIKG
jgi:hypothetical protein